jgi:hypothetical protein
MNKLYMKMALFYIAIAVVFFYLFYSSKMTDRSLNAFYMAPTVIDKQNIGVL